MPSDACIQQAATRRDRGLTLVCEDCRLENVGLIARTVECLGLASLHLVYTESFRKGTRGFEAAEANLPKRLSRLSKRASHVLDIHTHGSMAECAASLREVGGETALVALTLSEGASSLYAPDAAGCASLVCLKLVSGIPCQRQYPLLSSPLPSHLVSACLWLVVAPDTCVGLACFGLAWQLGDAARLLSASTRQRSLRIVRRGYLPRGPTRARSTGRGDPVLERGPLRGACVGRGASLKARGG